MTRKTELQNIRRSERRLRGRCSECDKVAVSGRALCAQHLLQSADKARLKRLRKKDRSECSQCSDEAPVGSRCGRCAGTHSREVALNRMTELASRLRNVLRTRLRLALRHNQKSGSAVRDLGCSIPELKLHLERKFRPGMTWENWSRDGWHIDHIKPLAKFDLTDRAQFLRACHYTNLQPLWAVENLKKSNRSTPPP